MSTSGGIPLPSSAAWRARAGSCAATALRPELRPPVSLPSVLARSRRGGEALGAVTLAVGWILLWTFFVTGVIEQAAVLRSTVERNGGGRGAAAEPVHAPQPPITARVRP